MASFEAYADDYELNYSVSALLEKNDQNQLDGTIAAGKKRNGVIGYEEMCIRDRKDGRRSPSRDKVISLCLALKLELPETQRALTLTKNGQLYSKNKRDSILIFEMCIRDSNSIL